jgi:hypothetical protein
VRQPGTEAADIPRGTLPAEARSRAETGKMVVDQEHAGAADAERPEPSRFGRVHRTSQSLRNGSKAAKSEVEFSISRAPRPGWCAARPSKTGAWRFAPKIAGSRAPSTRSVSSGSAEAPRDLAGSRDAIRADPGARRACRPNRNIRDLLRARSAKPHVSRFAADRRLRLLRPWRALSTPRSEKVWNAVTSWPITVPFRTTHRSLAPEATPPQAPKRQT